MSAYEAVQTGSLKLKGVSDSGIKKKKKKKDKKKEKEKLQKEIEEKDAGPSYDEHGLEISERKWMKKRTKAEVAFEKAQEKRNAELLMKKASTTHKERIMDFNRHLDGLTEHFDIPKVSWTK